MLPFLGLIHLEIYTGQQELKNIVAPDVTDRLRRNDADADPSTPIEH